MTVRRLNLALVAFVALLVSGAGSASAAISDAAAVDAVRAACAGPYRNEGQCNRCVHEQLEALEGPPGITKPQQHRIRKLFDEECDRHHNACIKSSCSAAQAQCGPITDNCGGNLDCGSCGAALSCAANRCVQLGPPPCYCATGQNYGIFSYGTDPGLFARNDGLVECACTDGDFVVLCASAAYAGYTKAGVVRISEARVNDYILRNITPTHPNVVDCSGTVTLP